MALFVTPFAYGNVQGMRMLEAKSWSDKDWDLFINWSDSQRYIYASDSDGVEITPTEYMEVDGYDTFTSEQYKAAAARFERVISGNDNNHHINYE